ncbi:hypothetical protein GGX14DRAFT_392927 [Mycena pura]|uniref:Uncharacterized protein n=1 Tax=Mycena pura TaxID=153505 RepID=A0AAD6YF24_9AGAR|nr:hypothetical protein GGX14DRAFT_392927 [Mycena pura]
MEIIVGEAKGFSPDTDASTRSSSAASTACEHVAQRKHRGLRERRAARSAALHTAGDRLGELPREHGDVIQDCKGGQRTQWMMQQDTNTGASTSVAAPARRRAACSRAKRASRAIASSGGGSGPASISWWCCVLSAVISMNTRTSGRTHTSTGVRLRTDTSAVSLTSGARTRDAAHRAASVAASPLPSRRHAGANTRTCASARSMWGKEERNEKSWPAESGAGSADFTAVAVPLPTVSHLGSQFQTGGDSVATQPDSAHSVATRP